MSMRVTPTPADRSAAPIRYSLQDRFLIGNQPYSVAMKLPDGVLLNVDDPSAGGRAVQFSNEQLADFVRRRMLIVE